MIFPKIKDSFSLTRSLTQLTKRLLHNSTQFHITHESRQPLTFQRSQIESKHSQCMHLHLWSWLFQTFFASYASHYSSNVNLVMMKYHIHLCTTSILRHPLNSMFTSSLHSWLKFKKLKMTPIDRKGLQGELAQLFVFSPNTPWPLLKSLILW